MPENAIAHFEGWSPVSRCLVPPPGPGAARRPPAHRSASRTARPACRGRAPAGRVEPHAPQEMIRVRARTCSIRWSTTPARCPSTVRAWNSRLPRSASTWSNSTRPSSACANSCASWKSRPRRRSSRAISAKPEGRRHGCVRSAGTGSLLAIAAATRAHWPSQCPTWSPFRACSTI